VLDEVAVRTIGRVLPDNTWQALGHDAPDPCGRPRQEPNARQETNASYRAELPHPFFDFLGSRNRTPGPPPFSSMNSTPAPSKALLMTSSVA
jgi:hypothetical protein